MRRPTRSPAREVRFARIVRRAIHTAVVVSAIDVASQRAAEPYLVKDINTDATGTQPRDLTVVGGRVFYAASDGVHGSELWVSDATSEGTKLAKDIHPGEDSSRLSELARVADVLVFWADDGLHGLELWVSDGTPEGTAILADLNPGAGSSAVGGFAFVGDRSVFWARPEDAQETLWGLWATDGTSGGTTLLEQFGSWLSDFTPFGDRLFFREGVSLWVTDGTPSGTLPFYELVGEPANWQSGMPVPLGDLLLFGAAASGQDRRLWISDGTSEGTAPLADITIPGHEGYLGYRWPSIAAHDRLLFASLAAVTSIAAGSPCFDPWWTEVATFGFWESDGTPEGTRRIGSLGTWPCIEQQGPGGCLQETPAFHQSQSKIFFTREDGHGIELWALDVDGTTVPPTGLEPPTGLRVLEVAQGTVTLGWRDNSDGESGYEVERRGPGARAFERFAELPSGSEEFVDTDLSPGVYWYRVRAKDAQGVSAFSGPVRAAIGSRFSRGDSNADGKVDLSDAVLTLGNLFVGGPAPTCLDAADADDTGVIEITDAIYGLSFLYLGGSAPPAPYPECGEDPTDDDLGCGSPAACP